MTAYGPALLWLCTLSVLFQGVLNTEMARYTLATGEPVFAGFMRLQPGPPGGEAVPHYPVRPDRRDARR